MEAISEVKSKYGNKMFAPNGNHHPSPLIETVFTWS